MTFECTKYKVLLRSKGVFWIANIFSLEDDFFFSAGSGKSGEFGRLITGKTTFLDKVNWAKIYPDDGFKVIEDGPKLRFEKS